MSNEAYRPGGTANPDYLAVSEDDKIKDADRRRRPLKIAGKDSGLSPMCVDTLFTDEYGFPGSGMEHDQP